MSRSPMENGFALRPYHETDAGWLAGLYASEPFRETTLGMRTFDEALPILSKGIPGLRILAAGAGRPIGLIAAERRFTPGGDVLWVRLLLVRPQERRKGYGREAFHRLLPLCGGRQSVKRVMIAVDARNEGGLAFWSSLGFRTLRRMREEQAPAQPIGQAGFAGVSMGNMQGSPVDIMILEA